MKYRLLLILTIALLPFSISAKGKEALLIGIGNYDTAKTGWRKIHGNNDVGLLTPILKKHGFDVTSLTDKSATKANIIKSLNRLANNCRQGDTVYIQFSGHGQQVVDCNGDETGGKDSAFIPFDALRTEGYTAPPQKPYQGENHLTDDELAPILNRIKQRICPGGELIVVFDACYSRGMEKGDDEDEPLSSFFRGTNEIFNPSDKSYLLSIPHPGEFAKGCRMTVISASRENERNFETKVGGKYCGAITLSIAKLIRDNFSPDEIINYFSNQEYRNFRIIPPYQHPSITIYP